VDKFLAKSNMTDCYPVTTPLPLGFKPLPATNTKLKDAEEQLYAQSADQSHTCQESHVLIYHSLPIHHLNTRQIGMESIAITCFATFKEQET
jgi:hypothetical protein